ncbi:hypothetical protein [Streptomyces sp. NBC_00344]|uniref:hypothetical protein n=1 Tax=Streptomyces sp. NBC_00344 TaxID=2975720 RepID=UPI002E2511FB
MEEGEPLNCRRWKAEGNCARKALRVAETATAERGGRKPVELSSLVVHGLRHFHASALIAGGASVKQVRLVILTRAPSSPCGSAPTWGGEQDRTRTVMDAILGGLRAGCGPGDAASKETAGQMT